MDLFGTPDIDKMAAEHDLDGLYRALEHRDKLTRFQAAQALADLKDETGWRFLVEHLNPKYDADEQEVAAAILGELGQPRAIAPLEEALKKARGETADVIRDAMEAIGGPEVDAALRRAGYAPIPPHLGTDGQVMHYDAQYVRPVLPDTAQVEFLTAEQHLNNAVELRESEMPERALVENSLALWLNPELAYAWYLRGVIFEDLDRYFEAGLCYHWALELDPNLKEANEALEDIETDEEALSPEEAELIESDALVETDQQSEPQRWHILNLLENMTGRDWRDRRDAAAGLGDLGTELAGTESVDRLIDLLKDEEREVRHAAIEALGNIEDERAILPLTEHEEGSWLLRFAAIEALAQLGSVEGLTTALRREMKQIQERNPVFTTHKDPLLEVEYERLMEIGVLALEKTGDLDALLSIAEDNTWVDEGEELLENEDDAEELASGLKIEYSPDYVDEEDSDDEVDEDLDSYVDEVGMMVCLALERLAAPNIPKLDDETLQRLSEVPDLTLLEVDATEDEEEEAEVEEAEPEESEPDLAVIRDLSPLREAARKELARRGK